jgi:hypothetical protein
MIIGTPYTIDFTVSTFNRTIDSKNSFTTRCLMGVNFRVVKPESPIIFVHATSLLTTQHWNLSIGLNMNLLPPKKLTIFILLSFSGSISILVPSSSFFYCIEYFYLSLHRCPSLFTSSLFIPPFILPKTKVQIKLLIFCTLGAIKKEWKKRKYKGWNGKEGPTFILDGPTELFLKTLHCLWSTISLLDINSSDALYLFVGFLKCIFAKMRHWFNDAFFTLFFLGFWNVLLPKCNISWLMPFLHSFLLDARKWVLLSSNNFLSIIDSTWESICNIINCWVFWIWYLTNIHWLCTFDWSKNFDGT